jgi:xyloglucan-specific endo-beta-1,4-glucanase
MKLPFWLVLAITAILLAVFVPEITAHAATTCTTSARYGTCSYPPYTVNNNLWGQAEGRDPGGTQTLTATSAGSWTATADFNWTQGGVISYPEVQEVLGGQEVAQTNSVLSTYQSYLHYNSSTQAESAYDIWLGDAAHGSKYWEEMVWTYTHDEQPAGSDHGNVTINGVQYQLWATSTDRLVTLVQTSNTNSGTVHAESDADWLLTHGYSASDAGYDEIDYGFEVKDTGGQNEPFQVSAYTLSVS